MAVEIELKARLEEGGPVKERLNSAGIFLHTYEKDDHYWVLDDTSVRISREKIIQDSTAENPRAKETILVTYKKKEIDDGIEINEENEFIISNAEIFEEFLTRIGMKPDINKEKRGGAWHISAAGSPPILAELSMVKNLGCFLELEILAESRGEKTVAASRKRLFDLLETLGIPREKIEARPYSVMLKNLGA